MNIEAPHDQSMLSTKRQSKYDKVYREVMYFLNNVEQPGFLESDTYYHEQIAQAEALQLQRQ
jgi:hypothetical protein